MDFTRASQAMGILLRNRRIILLSIIVILLYIVFTTPATLAPPPFNFHTKSYYSLLSEGFLSGQLSLPITPSEKLLALPNPYDPIENAGLTLHDASLYKGRYYLYFGPLPALFFFIPIKWLTGVYPTETLSVIFFLSVGFIGIYALLIKIWRNHFPEISEGHILFSGLLLSIATTAPFLLTRGLYYESTIACGFCMIAISLYFLYNIIVANTPAIRDIVLCSFFLGLSVAARPNFVLTCCLFIPIIFFHFLKHSPRERLISLTISLLTPVCIIAVGLAAYNYLRFDSIFQLGQKYQLTATNISKISRPMFNFSLHHISQTIYLYFFQSFSFTQSYRHFSFLPHVKLGQTIFPKEQPYYYEPVSGLFATSPIILFFLGIFASTKNYTEKNDASSKKVLCFLLFVSLATLIQIAFFVLFNSYPIQRYELDFSPYLVFLSIIGYWHLQKMQLPPYMHLMFKYLYIILGIISILIGLSIGITGYGI